jgi:hypothetical protein
MTPAEFLRLLGYYVDTDVSGLSTGSIFKGQAFLLDSRITTQKTEAFISTAAEANDHAKTIRFYR